MTKQRMVSGITHNRKICTYANLYSGDAVRCSSSLSKGGGSSSEVIKHIIPSRNLTECVSQSRITFRRTTVNRRITAAVRYLTFNSHSRQALRYQDDNHDIQKGIMTLQERRNTLQARLNAWFKIQAVYIPVAHILRATQRSVAMGSSGHVESEEEMEDASQSLTDNDAETAKLFLPSQLPPSLWSTGCMSGLHGIELKLRFAQTSDALEQLKQNLCVYSGLVHYKITQVSGPGQKANTRARTLLVRLREKINRCADRYRRSLTALETLDPKGDWQENFRPLTKSDIQGPNGRSPDNEVAAMSKQSKRSRGTGEGLRQLSWIWRIRRTGGAGGSRLTAEADLDKCESLFFTDLPR